MSASDNARMLKRRQEAKASGLCPYCMVRPPRAGMAACVVCAKARAAEWKAIKIRRIAEGKCARCESPATVRGLCDRHEAKRVAASKKPNLTQEKREKAGVCRDCGVGTALDTALCLACRKELRAQQKRRRAEWLAAGLCARCGKRPPRKGRRSCRPCAKRRRTEHDGIDVGCHRHCTRCGGSGHRRDSKECPLWSA